MQSATEICSLSAPRQRVYTARPRFPSASASGRGALPACRRISTRSAGMCVSANMWWSMCTPASTRTAALPSPSMSRSTKTIPYLKSGRASPRRATGTPRSSTISAASTARFTAKSPCCSRTAATSAARTGTRAKSSSTPTKFGRISRRSAAVPANRPFRITRCSSRTAASTSPSAGRDSGLPISAP